MNPQFFLYQSCQQPYDRSIDKGDRQGSAASCNLVLEPLHPLTLNPQLLEVRPDVATEILICELYLLGFLKRFLQGFSLILAV